MKNKSRFWEIDTLRGIAIIMMIIYHIIFDLYYFEILNIDIRAPLLRLFLYPIGTTFLILVGVSLTLSKSKSKSPSFKKFMLRGLKIFGLGIIITFTTLILLEEGYIFFGVLHCIGISIILSYKFLDYKITNLFLGIILVTIGIILRTMTFDFDYLFWLGFAPRIFYTLDYFPLLPWFGVILIGIFIGNIFYPNYQRSFKIMDLSKNKICSSLSYLGRHSLIIYFIHQPIIIGLILLLKG